MQPEDVAEAVALIIRPLVARITALEHQDTSQLRERIAVLETRAPVPGPAGKDGRDGVDGKDGTNGTNGLDGKDGRNGHGLDGYQGVYEVGKTYDAYQLVTHNGSLWMCLKADTSVRPETDEGAASWRLIVKRGDKGRDLRDIPSVRAIRG